MGEQHNYRYINTTGVLSSARSAGRSVSNYNTFNVSAIGSIAVVGSSISYESFRGGAVIAGPYSYQSGYIYVLRTTSTTVNSSLQSLQMAFEIMF